jgi:hypothetical protein
MKPHVFLIFIVILNITKIKCWRVQCDEVGQCLVILTHNNREVRLGKGYLPLIPDKFINPSSESSTTVPPDWYTSQKKAGISAFGLLPNSKFECGGGLNECINSCCKNGFCTDPGNICINFDNNIRIIILVVGFCMGILVILYWMVFHIMGVVYNSKPITTKSEGIYIKQSKFTKVRGDNLQDEIGFNADNNEVRITDKNADERKQSTDTARNNLFNNDVAQDRHATQENNQNFEIKRKREDEYKDINNNDEVINVDNPVKLNNNKFKEFINS